MGHQHLGTLPGSRKWRQVVQLISGGADVQDIAAATSAAAENQMVDASNDPAVKHAVWLLTQIPAAARKEDFASELRKLGLRISDRPTLIEVAAAMTDAVDRYVGKTGGRTDLGEMAQLSAVESSERRCWPRATGSLWRSAREYESGAQRPRDRKAVRGSCA